MLNLDELLLRIESVRQRIEAKGQLSAALLRKIEYQFRLECNYHSNRIEGGTLTKAETRSVMVGNITVDGKPLKDIREMKGHDDMMLEMLHIGQGKLSISPARVKKIHKTIIIAENPQDEAEIGQWKKVNNYVYNQRDERFDFLHWAEVPEAMQNLLNWLNGELDKVKRKDKKAQNPVILAATFHLRYLTIHPFVDGNGRTARLLSNLILVSCGYPPFWVSEGGEKTAYNRYLTDVQGYGGAPDLLYAFLAGLVLRSLELMVETIDGEI